jgi:antitoxin PrlF
MPRIRATATITSKGQVTLPKPIRQALGVDTGSRIAFDLRGDDVVVTRAAEEPHADPAIGAFLDVLARDIRDGRNLGALPDGLAAALAALPAGPVDLDDAIDGDVAL